MARKILVLTFDDGPEDRDGHYHLTEYPVSEGSVK